VAKVRAALASTNPHKARELERALRGWQIAPLAADYPPETGATFEENALAKARFGRSRAPADAWVLGEDSGIEVAALDGAPGVRSARWAAGDEVGRMLAAMAGVTDRRARYVCALAAIAPDGRELVVRGTFEGRIAEEASGSGGFGYDPVFVADGETETVAALGDAWKAERSHRARAAKSLLEALDST
jgi:XTP/dITP diphosphohydrolase